ncbi:beta-lactamase family protein [Flavobacteriaceae bacterium S0862]|nr:beta-lactamase family protein [Flavobacteriaceae bacterium S0862]
MKNMQFYLFIICSLLLFNCSSNDDFDIVDEDIITNTEIYFPSNTSNEWETTPLEELDWNENNLQSLLDFLKLKNTKSFIILYDGKIVVEKYFNGHNSTLPWYWASAGKTLTTAIIGIAEDEGLINIDSKVSDYIGTGWTSAPLDKENLITCKNLLSMTSGLDDGLGDSISHEDLQYVADAGNRSAYHNVYVKLQDVIAQTSNQTWTNYFNSKLKNKIGMSGSWVKNNDFNVYWSNAKSMARFGLLIYAKGKWENEQIIPEDYLNDAINTSQNINEAYGYLWWLNGKLTYHLPQSQFEFSGKLIPNAPNDMYSALGKNDQKIYIVPSKKLVIVRMGNSADNENFALSSFDNDLWEKISTLVN